MWSGWGHRAPGKQRVNIKGRKAAEARLEQCSLPACFARWHSPSEGGGGISLISGHLTAVLVHRFFSPTSSFPHSFRAETSFKLQDRSETWQELIWAFGNVERPGAEGVQLGTQHSPSEFPFPPAPGLEPAPRDTRSVSEHVKNNSPHTFHPNTAKTSNRQCYLCFKLSGKSGKSPESNLFLGLNLDTFLIIWPASVRILSNLRNLYTLLLLS